MRSRAGASSPGPLQEATTRGHPQAAHPGGMEPKSASGQDPPTTHVCHELNTTPQNSFTDALPSTVMVPADGPLGDNGI